MYSVYTHMYTQCVCVYSLISHSSPVSLALSFLFRNEKTNNRNDE